MAEMLLFGALPALLAAFCYPIGNQLVWQVSYNSRMQNAKRRKAYETNIEQGLDNPSLDKQDSAINITPRNNVNSAISVAMPAQSPLQKLIGRIPAIKTDLLQNAFNKVWLMTLGSLPFWLILGIVVRPKVPSSSQLFNTLLVALLAGVGATSIFLYAREKAVTSSEVAGVDSTQASEVIFALIGGILLLNNALPSAMGLIGIGLIIMGLILFAKDG